MICSECGKEINETDRFCKYCGKENVVTAAVPEEASSVENQKSYKKKLYITVGIIGILFLCAVGVCIFTAIQKFAPNSQMALDYEDGENVSETGEDASAPEEQKVGNAESGETAVAPLTELEQLQAVIDSGSTLLVGVPVEYLSLRQTPGLGDDVITQLKAGTYFQWDGASEFEDEKEFYYVGVVGGTEKGYVAEKYVTPVRFVCDSEDTYDIVDVTTALYTYDVMCDDIRELCQTYPKVLSNQVIGQSVDGRDLYELILGNPNASRHVMVQAGIHGREYMSTQLIMKMAEYYAYYYETGSYQGKTYAELFQNTAVHIVPMTNPDGVSISQFGEAGANSEATLQLLRACYEVDKNMLIYLKDTNDELAWYDNYKGSYNISNALNTDFISYEEYLTMWKANAHGVDLNNNFDAEWYELQVKDYPSFSNYRGVQPQSEPESIALCNLAQEYDFSAYISYHARGQLIYYDVDGQLNPVVPGTLELANCFQSINKYTPVPTQTASTVNLGGFGDWLSFSLYKPSITIEIGKFSCPVAIEEFDTIWLRNRETWAALCSEF